MAMAATSLPSFANGSDWRSFKRYDKNGDGIVEWGEYSTGRRGEQNRFQLFDRNRDGQITRKETDSVERFFENMKKNARPIQAIVPAFKWPLGLWLNMKMPSIKTQYFSDASMLFVWLPEDANEETPVVIFFANNGQESNGKLRVDWLEFIKLPDRGVSLVAVYYTPIHDFKRIGSSEYLPHVFDEAQKALAFIRSQASAWGVDANRIVLAGVSTGAEIAKYLAYEKNEDVDAVVAINTNFFGIELAVGDVHVISPYGMGVDGLSELEDGQSIVDFVIQKLGW
ncbi:MAG: alpha/beta hydrolase fold domain-containing protein [Pseudomonadota bacterium]